MNKTSTTVADLEQNSTVRDLAAACVRALHEAAATATTERFVRLCAHQVADAGELTPEGVVAHLQTTLQALRATALELYWAETAGRA